jgi:hypothetical protein
MSGGASERKFSRRKEDFTCGVCFTDVHGTGYTDHCPKCLYGKHVDINPGDRASKCGGLMKPEWTEHDRKRFIIHYVCQKCGIRKQVGAAKDDSHQLLEALLRSVRKQKQG